MQYWTAVDLLKQLCGELGLPIQTTVVGADNVQGNQLLAALNAAGNELLMYYPWEQFVQELVFATQENVGEYALPDDWKYFTDQTQWDRTNHWPLMGPKSPQEWAWLKGGLIAAFPRTRYRVQNNKFCIWPIPSSPFTPFTFAMEYIRGTWVQPAGGGNKTAMVTLDGDSVLYDPWLMIKFTKLKFYQLKQFDTTAVQADFLRVFESLKGKDVGAPTLSLTPRPTPQFIGPWSIPDGNWNVGG
jgi:hypothetical protein